MVTDEMVEAAVLVLQGYMDGCVTYVCKFPDGGNCECARVARAALEAADAASWQDISTAPRGDGKMSGPEILLSDGENVGYGYWFPGNRNPEGAGWADWDWTGDPTHWRPLPEPPTMEKAE